MLTKCVILIDFYSIFLHSLVLRSGLKQLLFLSYKSVNPLNDLRQDFHVSKLKSNETMQTQIHDCDNAHYSVKQLNQETFHGREVDCCCINVEIR